MVLPVGEQSDINDCYWPSKVDPVAKSRGTAIVFGLGESLEKVSPGRENDALRSHVIWVRRDLNVAQSTRFGLRKKCLECLSRMSTLAFPGHDRVADVAQAMRRQFFRPARPAKTY